MPDAILEAANQKLRDAVAAKLAAKVVPLSPETPYGTPVYWGGHQCVVRAGEQEPYIEIEGRDYMRLPGGGTAWTPERKAQPLAGLPVSVAAIPAAKIVRQECVKQFSAFEGDVLGMEGSAVRYAIVKFSCGEQRAARLALLPVIGLRDGSVEITAVSVKRTTFPDRQKPLLTYRIEYVQEVPEG